MPYESVDELPDAVKDNLPGHAQEIYMAAFNNAWDEYRKPEKRREGTSREETAHRVAWAAVKNKYEKDEETGNWKKKSD